MGTCLDDGAGVCLGSRKFRALECLSGGGVCYGFGKTVKYDRTVIGYHGCDEATAESVLRGGALSPSENAYDWLGRGVYFWEYGLDRAWRWANDRRSTPAVVGAVIQLGNCFDLLDTRFTHMLSKLAPLYVRSIISSGGTVPRNKGDDMKGRYLDCALINWVLDGPLGALGYQSVRCAFSEGDPVYVSHDGSETAIRQQSHVQIAVRDLACIVGTFRPAR